jgi:PTS system cellobiose-specific IIB component
VEKETKVVVLCAAGMSSSLICTSINNAAAKRNMKLEIYATPIMTYKELDYSDVDVILLAPQVRFQIEEVRSYLISFQIPVDQIGFVDYGMVRGDSILDLILKLLLSKKKTEDNSK